MSTLALLLPIASLLGLLAMLAAVRRLRPDRYRPAARAAAAFALGCVCLAAILDLGRP